ASQHSAKPQRGERLQSVRPLSTGRKKDKGKVHTFMSHLHWGLVGQEAEGRGMGVRSTSGDADNQPCGFAKTELVYYKLSASTPSPALARFHRAVAFYTDGEPDDKVTETEEVRLQSIPQDNTFERSSLSRVVFLPLIGGKARRRMQEIAGTREGKRTASLDISFETLADLVTEIVSAECQGFEGVSIRLGVVTTGEVEDVPK
ncbi:unnamed protein product, partial [Pleuronectes platessa]